MKEDIEAIEKLIAKYQGEKDAIEKAKVPYVRHLALVIGGLATAREALHEEINRRAVAPAPVE